MSTCLACLSPAAAEAHCWPGRCAKSRPAPRDPVDCSRQAPLCMGFSRQEYWSGLPFPPSGDLPDPGIKPRSPALQADSLPSEPPAVKKPSRLRGAGGRERRRQRAGSEASAEVQVKFQHFHLHVKFSYFAHRGFFASFFFYF